MVKKFKQHDWVKRKCKAWPGHIYKCSKCGMSLAEFHWFERTEREVKKKVEASDDHKFATFVTWFMPLYIAFMFFIAWVVAW